MGKLPVYVSRCNISDMQLRRLQWLICYEILGHCIERVSFYVYFPLFLQLSFSVFLYFHFLLFITLLQLLIPFSFIHVFALVLSLRMDPVEHI
jgi:hypothetical protein